MNGWWWRTGNGKYNRDGKSNRSGKYNRNGKSNSRCNGNGINKSEMRSSSPSASSGSE
jgi:hypothetical protein